MRAESGNGARKLFRLRSPRRSVQVVAKVGDDVWSAALSGIRC